MERVKYHRRLMQLLYVILIFAVGAVGIVLLVAPSAALSFMGFPAQEPMLSGVVYSMWLALAILSIGGLRSPLKYAPVLLMALTYKSVWLLAVILPNMISGTLPSFIIPTAIEWVLIVAVVAFVIPWKYMFTKSN